MRQPYNTVKAEERPLAASIASQSNSGAPPIIDLDSLILSSKSLSQSIGREDEVLDGVQDNEEVKNDAITFSFKIHKENPTIKSKDSHKKSDVSEPITVQ